MADCLLSRPGDAHGSAALCSRFAPIRCSPQWTAGDLWNLSFRTSFKTWAEAVFAFIEWLGPFIYAFDEEYPLLVGYLNDDSEGRPRLLWFKDRALALEDVNTDETRYG